MIRFPVLATASPSCRYEAVLVEQGEPGAEIRVAGQWVAEIPPGVVLILDEGRRIDSYNSFAAMCQAGKYEREPGK